MAIPKAWQWLAYRKLVIGAAIVATNLPSLQAWPTTARLAVRAHRDGRVKQVSSERDSTLAPERESNKRGFLSPDRLQAVRNGAPLSQVEKVLVVLDAIERDAEASVDNTLDARGFFVRKPGSCQSYPHPSASLMVAVDPYDDTPANVPRDYRHPVAGDELVKLRKDPASVRKLYRGRARSAWADAIGKSKAVSLKLSVRVTDFAAGIDYRIDSNGVLTRENKGKPWWPFGKSDDRPGARNGLPEAQR